MTRHFSESVAIRLRNAARRAARSRRTNKAEGCITGTNHKARRSFVPVWEADYSCASPKLHHPVFSSLSIPLRVEIPNGS
jgi:hypothetical protein